MASTKAIACHVRLRPPTSNDGKINPDGIKIEGNSISAYNKDGDKRYNFDLDKCHDVNSTQEEVFDSVKPMIEQAFKGQNTTIFTYGVTGAGKTHTMQGSTSDPGIIPRTVTAVFEKRSQLQSSNLRVSFSYVEILKDEVYDLLGERSELRKREIRMSAEGQNIVADLIIQPVNSVHEFNQIYDAAAKTRKTASTKLNSSSSRSHAILTLYIEISDNAEPGSILYGKICLTDLAGSENNNLTGNDKERMRESSAINTSLTTLGKVVDALNMNAQKGSSAGGGVFIPYRETKLTRLLQDALGGTSQGLLICCLAPGEKFARDTINTLQFANKSKSVENRLTVPEHNARRASAPLPKSTKSINPNASFKVHPGPRYSAPANGRSALSTISGNARPVRAINGNMKRDGKENTGMNAGQTEKENILGGMTDEQLDQKIQKIVSQQISREKELSETIANASTALDASTTLCDPSGQDAETATMTSEEKENRARVIVSHARKLHHSGDLQQALSLYKKAYEYVPSNRKLALRITEIQLSIEGIIDTKSSTVDRGQSEDKMGTAKSGMKRSHGHLDSLADLSYEESPAKKGRC